MDRVTTRHDEDNRSAVIETSFDHDVDTVWTLWADPGRIARWWGPRGIPLTVDHHDLRPGGSVRVTAHVPDRQPIRATWEIVRVEPPSLLAFTLRGDGVEPADVAVSITRADARGTQMTVVIRFQSDGGYAHARALGVTDGIARAVASAHAVLQPR